MHTFGENGAGVPAFLAKLWRLVDDPETNGLICWSKDGRSFIIQNQAKFARELLPLNYKHNNMASFIRQLNMYGFHKITSIENGGLKFDRDEMEFSHPCFKRNHPYLLEHIKRKIATSKNAEEKAALKPEAVTKVLQDVRAMRGRQDSLDSRFSVMKQENEALWREIASLRQKHAKQQQIVNKLIQFLITIVQPTRNMTGVKRHMQLMINDTPECAKLRTSSESESEAGSGPVIHELGEELLDEVADSVGQLYNNDDCASPSPIPMERPNSSISIGSQNYDYSNQSAEELLNNMPATPQSGSGGSTKGPPAVIKSINPDGTQVVYHVTEIPDAHPPEAPTPQLPMNDDNVLQTPMVREQMARAEQLLKQKNNRRRKNDAMSQNAGSVGNGAKVIASKVARLQDPTPKGVEIKSEQKLDPMQFLNVYTDNSLGSPAAGMSKLQQQQLLSPMLNDDSQQSQQSMGIATAPLISPVPSPLDTNMSMMAGGSSGDKCGPDATSNDMNDALSLYSSNFIDNEIPSDIFEDSSILSAGDNSNNSAFNQNLKLALQQQQQQQQDTDNYLLSKLNNGKFAAYANGSNANGTTTNGNGVSATNGGASGKLMSNNDGPSTSTAAAGAGTSKTGNDLNNGNNANNMAVTQYKPAEHARTDVHGHIDALQDELDSLKELLRSDGYSLDNSILMSLNKTGALSDELVNYSLKKGLDEDIFTKLFNDSDILGPFGLQMPLEGQNEKKGSELISYQPSYDLSDIMNINNEGNLDTVDDDCASPSNIGVPQTSSVLNTPYHD